MLTMLHIIGSYFVGIIGEKLEKSLLPSFKSLVLTRQFEISASNDISLVTEIINRCYEIRIESLDKLIINHW